MRYAATLTLAVMSTMTGVAFLMEWRDAFPVLAVITTVVIGLPILSLASNFWFGEMPPHHHDADCDRLSWLNRRERKRITKANSN